MVGNANSGGKPQSIEDRIKKVNAGRMRHGNPGASLTGKTLPQDKLATIQDYDEVIGQPLNWGDVKKREEVIEILEAAAKRRGDLIARQDAEDSAKEVYGAFVRLGDQLPVKVVQSLTDALDMETRAKVRVAVEAAWADIMQQVGKRDAKAPE